MPMRDGSQFTRVKIEGLTGFNEAVRQLSASDTNEVRRKTGKDAAELVIDKTKPKIPLGPGIGGHARHTLRVVNQGVAFSVQAGGPRFSYYPWLDFGGRVGKNQSVRRKFIKDGRYVWATYYDLLPMIQGIMEKHVQGAVKRKGLS